MLGKEAIVIIAGTKMYNYEYVSLNQFINEHHDFEIGVDIEVIETQGMHTLDKAKSWLGESVMLNVNGVPFAGVVTNVEMRHDKGLHGQLVVTGYSKTIDLDSIPHMHSWLEKPLKFGFHTSYALVVRETFEDDCNRGIRGEYLWRKSFSEIYRSLGV